MKRLLIAGIVLALLYSVLPLAAQTERHGSGDLLAVLWTTGDPESAHRVCLMYTHNTKTRGWFAEVLLIAWGPSARLLAADKDIQEKVIKTAADGGL